MSEGRMFLPALVEALNAAGLLAEVRGDAQVEVRGVSQDSRSAGEGDLFLAWKGKEHDGHDFLPAAVEAGAVAAVVERFVPGVAVPQIRVARGRDAAALAADRLHGSPWRELGTAGVTGTNGKTTTTLLLRHLLSGKGPAAAVGTLGLVGPDGEVRPGTEGLTTPGPVRTSSWLRDLADDGVRFVALEASSHALEQRRLDGVRFDVAIFTNLSREHLDYHGHPEAYLAAKARLVGLLKPGGAAVVNAADPAWRSLPEHDGPRISFAVEARADLTAMEVALRPDGARFLLAWGGGRVESVDLPLPGGYNVENALAAAGGALALGIPLDRVARGLDRAPQLPGRMERVVREPFTVIIDFAHTPDALIRVLDALKPLVEGRLIVVFGAGGDRDAAKRPAMGAAVTRLADLAIVTSDNPRTEDPDAIIDDVIEGVRGEAWERITDRREAIFRALELAREGDVVLLAGKGHERYQVVGREKRPFDEREVVREALGGGRAA